METLGYHTRKNQRNTRVLMGGFPWVHTSNVDISSKTLITSRAALRFSWAAAAAASGGMVA